MAKEKTVSVAEQYRKRSQFAEFWRRFKMNKGALVGLAFIILLILLSAFSDVIFDYNKDIATYNLKERYMAPCKEHPFGTDSMGRDMFKRVLYGAKYSLGIAFSAIAFSMLLGFPFGAFCGFKGGAWDLIGMRFVNIWGAIPDLLMGIVVVAALGKAGWVICLAMGIARLDNMAGMGRIAVMTVRSQEYVESAKAIGMGTWAILFKHVLPNCLSQVIVRLTLSLGGCIIAASSLSYLGLGVQPPTPEWGALLSGSRSVIDTHPYLCLFPGLAITLTVIAFNQVGDGVRDALDPKLKK